MQICPVGALTGAAYRFRARPFDLVSTPSVCEHCASGCAQRADWRRGKVLRRLAGEDPAVNEEWNCDKGRWAFTYATAIDRLTLPMIREDGQLRPAAWTEALEVAAAGLLAAKNNGGVGVLAGGRLTYEDAYAYSKFARLALGSNDVDFRSRPHSAEEAAFLAAHVAGSTPLTGGVTYADLETAPAVLLVGLEPEEESPIIFLRLRKAARKLGLRVWSIAPLESRGLAKMGGTLIQATPGSEPKVLDALRTASAAAGTRELAEVGEALRSDGAIVLLGERLATVPGAFTAAASLAHGTGARLAWVPRRAGDRGAVEAGLLPNLLPGTRPVTDSLARSELAAAWGVDATAIPAKPGRDTSGMLAAAAGGELAALVVGAVDPNDLPDPQAALVALDAARFVVSLEIRASAVTERADVVFPVAPAVERSGTYLDWEGRERPFELTLEGTGALTDARVLTTLAEEMDVLDDDLGAADVDQVRIELAALPVTRVLRPGSPAEPAADRPHTANSEAILATWHHLLDLGSLQDGEEHLAGTAKPAVVRLSAATAAGIGVADGEAVAVTTDRGEITLPLVITPMPDHVVWVPTNSIGSRVRSTLGVDAGAVVGISAGRLPAPDSPAGLTGTGPDGAAGEGPAGDDPKDVADASGPGAAADPGEPRVTPFAGGTADDSEGSAR